MNRIDYVHDYVDAFLEANRDSISRKYGYIHLYCVSQACAMLALKRGQDVELAVTAGLLHDVCTYKFNDSVNHARKGAVLARDILENLGNPPGLLGIGEKKELFSAEEIDRICQAICNHSDKERVDAPLDEILKDADVLQHCLYDPTDRIPPKERSRFEALKKELGLADSRSLT